MKNTLYKYYYTFILCSIFLFFIILYCSNISQNNRASTSYINNKVEINEITSEKEHLTKQSVQNLELSKNNNNSVQQIDTSDIEFLLDDAVDFADLEWFQSKLKDPKQVVKMQSSNGLNYYKYAQAFNQNDLPAFYEILNDPNSSPFERIHAINFIGHITDRGNIKTSRVLMDYVQKEEVDWDRWQKDDAYYITVSKRFALDWLGYVGYKDQVVKEFLKKAMTPDGIREITKQWYKEVPESASSERAIIENLRGYAAKGLAYSDDLTIHNLIIPEYEREKQTCINSGLVGDYYFYQLCEAVTRIDIIKDIGIEGHLALSDGKMSYDKTYLKYQIKYLINKPSFDVNNIELN